MNSGVGVPGVEELIVGEAPCQTIQALIAALIAGDAKDASFTNQVGAASSELSIAGIIQCGELSSAGLAGYADSHLASRHCLSLASRAVNVFVI